MYKVVQLKNINERSIILPKTTVYMLRPQCIHCNIIIILNSLTKQRMPLRFNYLQDSLQVRMPQPLLLCLDPIDIALLLCLDLIDTVPYLSFHHAAEVM